MDTLSKDEVSRAFVIEPIIHQQTKLEHDNSIWNMESEYTHKNTKYNHLCKFLSTFYSSYQ